MGRRIGFRPVAIGRMAAAAALLALSARSALADIVEQPEPWQMWFQPAASPVRQHIDFLHDDVLMPIITAITILVLGLLLYVIIKFSAKNHPVPSRTTHHTWLEFTWSVLPIFVLLFIWFPSIKLMFYMDHAQKADMTLKVTGHQWYWSYEYPDNGDFSFDSNMMDQAEAVKEGKPRLLEVDHPIYLPVNTVVRILVTGTDVMHSFFLPSMGVQEYAVIGRTNESWLSVNQPGTYYGQCNQICGINHPFMPIEIKAVSKEDFAKWAADQKKNAAKATDSTVKLAAASAQ